MWRRGTCSRSPDALVAEGGPSLPNAEIPPLHQAEFCQVTHSGKLRSSESKTRTQKGRASRILSSYLVVQVSGVLGQGYVTTGGRARTEIHFSWLQIHSFFSCMTLCNIREQHYLQEWLRLGNSNVIFSFMSFGVEGAAFYFTCVLETLWWGSVCLTLGGVFIVIMSSSCKENFTVNQKAVWFIAVVVDRREYGVWLLNRRWLLFKFNEVNKRQVNWLQTCAGELAAEP